MSSGRSRAEQVARAAHPDFDVTSDVHRGLGRTVRAPDLRPAWRWAGVDAGGGWSVRLAAGEVRFDAAGRRLQKPPTPTAGQASAAPVPPVAPIAPAAPAATSTSTEPAAAVGSLPSAVGSLLAEERFEESAEGSVKEAEVEAMEVVEAEAYEAAEVEAVEVEAEEVEAAGAGVRAEEIGTNGDADESHEPPPAAGGGCGEATASQDAGNGMHADATAANGDSVSGSGGDRLSDAGLCN